MNIKTTTTTPIPNIILLIDESSLGPTIKITF
jgi:hypothetical protein